MNRRDAIRYLGLAAGAAIVGPIVATDLPLSVGHMPNVPVFPEIMVWTTGSRNIRGDGFSKQVHLMTQVKLEHAGIDYYSPCRESYEVDEKVVNVERQHKDAMDRLLHGVDQLTNYVKERGQPLVFKHAGT